jgi:hypothetical protein
LNDSNNEKNSPNTDAKRVTKAWRKAGGKFESEEKLFMVHDKKQKVSSKL